MIGSYRLRQVSVTAVGTSFGARGRTQRVKWEQCTQRLCCLQRKREFVHPSHPPYVFDPPDWRGGLWPQWYNLVNLSQKCGEYGVQYKLSTQAWIADTDRNLALEKLFSKMTYVKKKCDFSKYYKNYFPPDSMSHFIWQKLKNILERYI